MTPETTLPPETSGLTGRRSSPPTPRPALVITGVGAVTALGRGLEPTRAALAEGRSAIASVEGPGILERKDPSPAARIGKFTTEPEMPKSKARRLDLGSQYAIVAARHCLADAGWEMKGHEERTGIVLGSGSAGAGPLNEFERQLAQESPETASPFLFPNTVANAPASQTALELAIQGPNVTITHKDSGALNSLFYARFLLWDDRADAILVGGADEWHFNYHYAYERVLATGSARRPGYVLGEGAGFVLLETEVSARERSARVRARLAGIGHRTAPVSPQRRRATPEALAATMRDALDDAALSTGSIGLVHLMRNGVPWMDAAEDAALADVFGATAPRAEAIKLQIGENPAIGAVQLALAAERLSSEPGLGAVLVNGFGAGGNFLCAVLTAASS